MLTAAARDEQQPVNLNRLPKDKVIIDFLLGKLSAGASPERFELLSTIFELYRTSAGFDPIALSKGRFMRIKASEFKKAFREIDAQIGTIIQSDEYRQLLARETDYSPLFSAYTKISDEVRLHPVSTMIHDVAEFEDKLDHSEASELQMTFYRQHHAFYKESKSTAELEQFLEKYDGIVEKSRRHGRRIRCTILVKILTEKAIAGKADYPKMEALWKELEEVLTVEKNKFSGYEVLLDLLTLGRMFPAAGKRLATYLDYAAIHADDLLVYNAKHTAMFYATLAQFHPTATSTEKSGWLQHADQIARDQGEDETRAYYRLIRSMIATDAGDVQTALRHLDEAEHQIHRGRGRSFSSRNTWIEICRLRSFLFALSQMKGETRYEDDQYLQLKRLAEDLSQHRYDSAIISLELSALLSFLHHDWESARHSMSKAAMYRSDEPRNAMLIIDTYFDLLMGTEKGREKKMETLLKELEQLQEPFYSTAGKELLVQAQQYYHSQQLQKVS